MILESKSNILKILNLEKSEVEVVLWTFLYSFFLGTAIAFFFTGSTSLFLSSFEKEMIPLSFIIAGIIVIVIGQLYSHIQPKFKFSFTIIGALAFLLISFILLIVLFTAFESIILVFALYAWNRVIAYIHNVVFWGMAGKLFSLQQAKRVFGLISGGEVIGLMIAFFSIPVLLKFINTEELIIIAGIALLIGFLILLIITRKFSVKLTSVTKKKTELPKNAIGKKTSFYQNRYYKLFFIIAFVPIFVQFFVDFIFQAQVKIEYPDKEDLTAFVGIFFGFSSIVEFMLRTFSGKLLSRYGMKLGLLAYPGVMAFSFILATLFGFIYGAMFFSFIALGRLFTRAARTSFNDPATQLLYQPLPADERVSFQNKVESGPKAYASIVAGILLFLFAKIPGFDLVYFSLFLFIIIIFWSKTAIEIYKEYRVVLQNILAGKRDSGQVSDHHPIIRKILLKLKSGNFNHAKPIIKLSRLLIPFETEKALELNNEYLESGQAIPDLKYNTTIEMSKSDKESERIIAVKQMLKYSIYKVEKPITRLLHDNEFEVKCEAIITASKLKETEFYSNLITLFHNPEYKITVSDAIKYIGASILQELDQNFQKTEYDISNQLKTIELVEHFKGEEALQFLKRNIRHHNKFVSDRAIKALVKQNYTANTNESLLVWQKVENEIKNYVVVSRTLNNLKGRIDSPDLINALEFEKKEKKNKVFINLSVLYDPFAIKLIADSLESSDKNQHGFALEVADTIISDLHKPKMLPLIESDSDSEIIQRYMNYFPTEKLEVVEQLIDIINAEYWVIGLFAKATAIKLLLAYHDSRIHHVLMANAVHPRPIIWQLAIYNIHKKDKALFTSDIYLNSPKIAGLREFVADIESYEKGTKPLIYDRLISIKSLQLFNELAVDELIEIATNSKNQIIEKDRQIELNRKDRQYFLIISGRLQELSSNLSFENGDILCPFLMVDKEIEKYVSNTEVNLIAIEMHLINNLVVKNYSFAEKLTNKLWKDDFFIEDKVDKVIPGDIMNTHS